MNITSTSMTIKAITAYQEINIAVTKLGMDTAKTTNEGILKLLEQSINPHLGGHINYLL